VGATGELRPFILDYRLATLAVTEIRGSLVPLRLLAVHAHPDDESSKGSATYAHYRKRGVEVLIVSATGGEQGSILNENLEAKAHAVRDMAGLRVYEMAAAQQVMDVDHLWLGFADSGLPEEGEEVAVNSFATIPVEISAEPLVRVIRRFRPHVLVTYDENGGYPHPDHIRTHEISVAAYEAAADGERYPEAGPAWQVSKLYYDRIMNSAKMHAIYDAIKDETPDSPILAQMDEMFARWGDDRPDLSTTHIDVADSFEIRDDALRAHASQVDPTGFFFRFPLELQQRVWPTEDFQLIDSKVETTLPETDLFAGISPAEAGE
jgi:mycothiol S-conjugate amidase